MDYLTILSTRSVLFFASPANPHSSHSDDFAPTTPTTTIPAPPSIAIPLSNLTGPDSRIFFFLQQHVLRRPEHLASRDERIDAEVMVWRELAKADNFLWELGMAAGRGEMKEAGLRDVARRCGLNLVPAVRKEAGRAVGGKKRSLKSGYCSSVEGSQNLDSDVLVI